MGGSAAEKYIRKAFYCCLELFSYSLVFTLYQCAVPGAANTMHICKEDKFVAIVAGIRATLKVGDFTLLKQ